MSKELLVYPSRKALVWGIEAAAGMLLKYEVDWDQLKMVVEVDSEEFAVLLSLKNLGGR